MKVIYIADDGTQFEDKWTCEGYEWALNHKNIYNVLMYNENGNKLTDFMSQETYENADIVVVPDRAALEDLHELARFTGYCYYHQIERPGRWEFKMDGHDGRYVKTN